MPYKLIPPQIEKSIIEFTKYTNFLYLFIACIIVGSILGMDRNVLVKGFVKIFVPLALGSIAAGIVGTLVGTVLGLGAHHSFFYVVLPIMAGGVGEGAIRWSGIRKSCTSHRRRVRANPPPIMLGSLTAIILSGTLNYVGKRYPSLTGEGRLQPAEHDDMDPAGDEVASETGGPMDGSTVAAAGLAAITLYLLGGCATGCCAGAGGDVVPCSAGEAHERGFAASAAGGFVVYKFFSPQSPIRSCSPSAFR